MQVLIAVIDDLFQFAYTALFGAMLVPIEGSAQKLLGAPEVTKQPTLPTFSSVATLLEERVKPVEENLVEGMTYYIGDADVYLFYEPVFAFDSAVCLIAYGTSVVVQKLGGRWAHVTTDFGEGWILRDSLRRESSDVFPLLAPDVVYTHEHREVQKLRRCIGDTFSGERSGLMLQDTEFVTYRLGERGKRIPWTGERPRTPGVWQRLLRGKKGVHISIIPKEGAIMEYTHDDVGHLGFVETVFQGESITVSAVGLLNEGEYTQTMLAHDVWKELHPVFISIV